MLPVLVGFLGRGVLILTTHLGGSGVVDILVIKYRVICGCGSKDAELFWCLTAERKEVPSAAGPATETRGVVVARLALLDATTTPSSPFCIFGYLDASLQLVNCRLAAHSRLKCARVSRPPVRIVPFLRSVSFAS